MFEESWIMFWQGFIIGNIAMLLIIKTIIHYENKTES